MEMLRIAVEKGADLDQLQKLMDLQERWERGQAKRAYDAALAAFKAEAPAIARNRPVDYRTKTGIRVQYDHATLDHVVGQVGPALARFGLSHSWSVDQPETPDGFVAVTCHLAHAEGHAESVTIRGPYDNTGSKNPVQATGSTITYLERYTLLAITGLAAGGTDDDGSAGDGPPITAAQKEPLIALIRESGADTAKLIKFFKVESIDVLPADAFNQAVSMLEKKRMARREPGEEG